MTLAGIAYVILTPQGRQILGQVTKTMGDMFKTLPDTGGLLTPFNPKGTGTGTVRKTTGGGTGSGPLSGPVSAASSGSCAKTIYRATGKSTSGGPGKNQGIHYASSGKAATSHRTDIMGWTARNYEATAYLTWPSSVCGKDQLTLKFWGPSHTDSTCCWCMITAQGNGQIGFGGEGPHPSTTTFMAQAGNVGALHGKRVGLKGVIWSNGGSIHQEAWIDLGSGWRKVGQHDRSTCGKDKTETNPVSSQDVEFRFDCGSVSYACTSVAEISPGGAVAGAGYLSGEATQVQAAASPTASPIARRFTKDDYNRILAIRKRHALFNLVRAVDPVPHVKHSQYLQVADYQNSCD